MKITLTLSTRALSEVEAIISDARLRMIRSAGWQRGHLEHMESEGFTGVGPSPDDLFDRFNKLFDPIDTRLPRAVRGNNFELSLTVDQVIALNDAALARGAALLECLKTARVFEQSAEMAKHAERLAAVAVVLATIASGAHAAQREAERDDLENDEEPV